MADETALQVVETPSQISRPQSFAPQTFAEALTFAGYLAKSTFVPAEFRGKPENILVAMQHGAELGLPPLQSLNCICVINGKAAIYGPSALAVVKSHRDFEYIKESFDKASMTATCEVKRRGEPAVIRTFSKENAIRAGLWDERAKISKRDGSGDIPNPAPWHCYPERMLMFRARGFALNDCLPDALRGIITAEEAGDYPGETIEGNAQATPAAEEKKEATIGQTGGSEFYKAYKASGWSPEESKKFLADTFQIGHPHNELNSKDIPESKKEEAMKWAQTHAPIRIAAENKFEQLGWTSEERFKFFQELKGVWAEVDKALAAEIAKRDAQERGE
jgi:hypothetical protein